jgi:hypothetical protein
MWSIFSKGRRIFYSPNRYLIDWGLERILGSSLRFYKGLDGFGPITSDLLLYYTFSNTNEIDSAYYYKWFSTNGTNPTTESGFNSFFIGTPQSYGISYNSDINWTQDNRPSYLPLGNFAWEVTAFLKINVAGDYQFNTRSDDGNQLLINDVIVCSFYGPRGINDGETSSLITLSAGLHKFKYRMQQGGGGSAAQVKWKIPNSDEFTIIPASNFIIDISNEIAVDLTEKDNDGLLNGATWDVNSNEGIVNFDGINDYISTTNEMVSPSVFTTEVWVRTTQTGKKIIGFENNRMGNSSSLYDRHLYVNTNGQVAWGIFSDQVEVINSTILINDGLWHHLLGIFDGQKSELWVDGQKQGELNLTGLAIYNGWWRLGSYRLQGWSGSSGDGFFNGSIGLARVWETVLSSSQITNIYNTTKSRFTDPVLENLVLYYDPSNSLSYSGSGTTISDLTNNNLDGTLSNITFSDPYLRFNGSSSNLSIADNSLLEPGSGDWTVEVWINHSVISGSSRCILGKTNGGNAADWGYGIRTISTGATYLEVGNGITSIISPSYILSVNTWYQVVGVWNNVDSNSIQFYVNGNLIGSNSHSFTSIKNTTRPISLGSFDGGATFGQWVNGKYGVVRIYNKALSSLEVLQNYDADKSKYGLT